MSDRMAFRASRAGRTALCGHAWHLVQRLIRATLVDRAAAPRRLALRDVSSAGASGAGEDGSISPDPQDHAGGMVLASVGTWLNR
jgi:hypothetical protein